MNNLYLKTLGPPQIELDGAIIQGFESEKALAVLIYLLLQRQPVSRTFLYNFFWSELPEERAQGNLRRVLHNLNQLFPDFLVIDRRTVHFPPQNSCRVDLWEFEKFAQGPQNLANWEATLALYQGTFLEGLNISPGLEFDRWLEFEREHWQNRALQILEKLSLHYTGEGDYARALEIIDRALSLVPWNENFHRQKMYLLACNGQRSAALHQYQICRRVLAEELDAGPSAETEWLYHRLNRLVDTARHTLPPALEIVFIGRQAELNQIAQKLLSPHCRILTLTGPSGIGKTCLALQAAQQSDFLFLDGAIFIPLAEVHTAQAFQQALLTAFNNPAGSLASYLQDKELLLILDNFENLLTPTERYKSLVQLTNLSQAAPRIKLLVTSCDRLGLATEWVITLTGLPVGPECRGTAQELFLARARQAGNAPPETTENLAVVHQICELLEGHPLSIELAAALVPYLSPEEILRQIRENLDTLSSPYEMLPPRHRSMRAVFERSWERLSPAEQDSFAALSVFKGGFTLAGAGAVADAAFPMLQQLTAKSLIRLAPGNRYQIHETLRRFAEEKLHQSGHADLIQNRHLHYFAALIDRLEKENGSAMQAPQTRALVADYANLIAALRRARQSQSFETGLNLALGMLGVWDTTRAPGEGCEWLATLADQATHVSAELRARAYSRAGGFAWRQGNLALAERYQRTALEIQRQQGDRKGLAITLSTLSLIYTHSGNLQTAMEQGRESLAIFRELNDQPYIALTLNSLGMSAVEMGALEEAQNYLRESRTIYQQLGLKRGQLMVLNNLGNVARYQRDFEQAVELFNRALELTQELSDMHTQAIVHSNLGYVYACRSQSDQAREFYHRALEQFSKLERLHDLTDTLERIAALETETGEKSRAVSLFAAAATLRIDLNFPLSPIDQAEYDQSLTALKNSLPPALYNSLWEKGKKLSWRQGVDLALQK